MVAAMSIFGVLAISVATFSVNSSADESLLGHIVGSQSAIRQCFFLLLAPVIISFFLAVPYDLLRMRARFFYVAATGLVFVTLVTNGAEGVKAWTDLIWGYTMQPSEFIKLALILILARDLSKYDKPMSTVKQFVHFMLLVGIPMLIVLASGEMGSMLVVVFIFAVMLFFSGVDMRLLIAMGIAAVLAVMLIYGLAVASGSDNYRLLRILAFINPEQYSSTDAYQQTQAKIAIGSGGFSGIGMFVNGSMSQLNYVPADWTDFIFATIGEAWGFVGCCCVLLMYLLIILRMLYLAYYTRDNYGMLVIIGVMAMLLFHVFENIGMNIGLMPITGIPLPFVSYGGSNMTTNIAGIGLVLNVTRNRSLTASTITPRYYRSSGRL